MDHNRIYNNPGLEARRLALLHRLKAEEEQFPREPSAVSRSTRRQIQQGFERYDKQKSWLLSRWIADSALLLNAKERSVYRALLAAVARGAPAILAAQKHVERIAQ